MVVSEAIRIEPASGSSRPPSIRSSVVLPLPFGPDRPIRSFFLTCQDTSSKRTLSPYRFVSPSTWISFLLRHLQVVEAGALEHLAMLGVDEVQAVLVDDLD